MVTGGAGFIGCALSAQIADRFARVIAIDNLHPQVHASQRRPMALDSRVELIVGDVCDSTTWEKALAIGRPDVVIHLAAETGTAQSLSESARHANVNVVGTAMMLDGFTKESAIPSRILLSSSRAVYGEGAWISDSATTFYPGQRTLEQLNRGQWDFAGKPLAMSSESINPMPVSVYGATKLAQEHVLSCWCRATGAELNILRLQNVFGPGQSLTNSYTGIVSLFCQMARAGEIIPLYEDGLVQRDFIYITDIANAFIAALETSRQGLVLDIGSGSATTLLQLAACIAEIYSAPPPIVVGKFRLGDVRHAFADSSPSKKLMGWQAEESLKGGLVKLANWINDQLSDSRKQA